MSTKSAEFFECKLCDFVCSKKSDLDRHKTTRKHKNQHLSTEKAHFCDCGKQYKDRSGLWRHRNKCGVNGGAALTNDKEFALKNDTIFLSKLILDVFKSNKNLQKQNNELQKQYIDICNNFEKTTNINSNINSNNKTFNLNIFLNEECKDAMNIMDFVDSVKLQLSDLENVGKLGFVKGITNIILKNLKEMDICKRPVHCSDTKREIMYVKDENIWHNDSKEEKQKNIKLKKAIKHIAHKNTKLLSEYKEKNPDCIYSESQKSDIYNKIVIEAFGGSGNNNSENENKIIKNLSKELIINKIL